MKPHSKSSVLGLPTCSSQGRKRRVGQPQLHERNKAGRQMVVIGFSVVFGGEGKKFESFQDRAGGRLQLLDTTLRPMAGSGQCLIWYVGIGAFARLEIGA